MSWIIVLIFLILAGLLLGYLLYQYSNRRKDKLGSERDIHGCIPSAGYRWCEVTQKCIRPWEEKC